MLYSLLSFGFIHQLRACEILTSGFKCNALHGNYKIVLADIEIAVEKKAVFINDYKHDTSMAGDWARKVSNMCICFLTLRKV